MAGEAIVLNMKSGVYFGMEQVAALIWDLIEKRRSVREIRDAIMKEYEVDSNTCEKDLKSFLDDLQSAGLIEIDNNEACLENRRCSTDRSERDGQNPTYR